MINPEHLLLYVIRPTLIDLDLDSKEAEELVLGTACVESECGLWLKQLGKGPGLGIYQCEPATYEDLYKNFLNYQPGLKVKVDRFAINPGYPEELQGNLYYATAICRVHYYRFDEPIPTSLIGQSYMWKSRYNTKRGAGTEADYIEAWRRFMPEITVAV